MHLKKKKSGKTPDAKTRKQKQNKNREKKKKKGKSICIHGYTQ
jgi:hypothetical protein